MVQKYEKTTDLRERNGSFMGVSLKTLFFLIA